MQTCSRCVMDQSDPDIVFDEYGICNHCHQAQRMIADLPAGRIAIMAAVDRMRRSEGEYDCLIGLSGGVDSSLALHYALMLGLRPMTFTIDNGWNTPEADENIMRLVETLKVPFFRFTIDLGVFHDLQAAFLRSGTANLEIPTDHILMAASYQMAREHGIKYIISGGNVATESIMPKAWGYNARDLRFIKAVYATFGGKEDISTLPLLSLFGYLRDRFIKGIQIVNLLDYYVYDREEAKRILSEKYGWKDYGEKHCESVYTQWFQNRYLPLKFGYDKRKPHYSSLINSGQMTREDALVKLTERQVYPEIISWNFLKVPRKSYRDFPNSEWVWNLLSKIYAHIKN